MNQVSRVGVEGRSSGWGDQLSPITKAPTLPARKRHRRPSRASVLRWKIRTAFTVLSIFWVMIAIGFLGLAFNEERISAFIFVLCGIVVSTPALLKMDDWGRDLKEIGAKYIIPLRR